VDALADLLGRAQAHGSLFAHSKLRGAWGLRIAEESRLSVHAVLSGELWCKPEGRAPVHVPAGHVLLLRTGGSYDLLGAPGAAPVPLERVLAEHGPSPLELPGEGPVTELLCGSYSFRGVLCEDLLAALPPAAVVPADDPTVTAALGLLTAEVRAEHAGRQTVLDRALDVLLVALLRVLWADQLRPPVWAGAPQDRAVAAALRALHGDPAHPWTVAELARLANVSRASLARRFAAEVGSPPLTYLTWWRMRLAREALVEGATLAQVARQVGYATEYAFAAAFTREVGTAPGRWRRAQQPVAASG
jgi:AraC-like DNA-binding protein